MGGGGSKSQLIGYKYYMGMHIVVCHSPEESPVQSIRKIEAGERIAWEGNVTSNGSITINQPGLFGGDRKEGGIVGLLNVLFGRNSQTQNTYLQRQQGQNIPAYRGVFGLVLNRMYLTAISPYVKPWAIEVVRPASANWSPQWASISDGANAAHIIREALTNNSWGLGLPVSLIDDASFSSVAETLYNEGFGLSMILSGQESIEQFIDRVLTHVNGVRIIDTTTGQYKIRLIRDDYTVSSLPIFDESNSELQNFERPQYAEMVNEITIVYTPQGERDRSSITVQDLASIQSQGGSVQQTLQFPGIDNLNIASRVGQRELRQHSTPLAQITLLTNRSGFEIEPGDVFRLNWESYGINGVVFRAISVDIGDLTNGRVRIDAIEDIFALPSASYIVDQPTQWEDPIQLPTPVLIQRAEELTYWDIQMNFDATLLSEITSTSAFYKLLAQKPAIASPGYQLVTRVAGASNFEFRETGAYTPTAQLASDLGPGTTSNISIINVDSDLSFFTVGSYAYINNEIVRVDTLDLVTNTINVGRGCLDTVATTHLANSRIYFAENFDGTDITQYTTSVQVEGKALVQTGQDILNESLAPIASETFVGRQNKPYPPGQLRFNSLAYPENITGELTISWAHRDREQQLVRPIISEESGNIGPEMGVTYNLELYGEDLTTVRRSETGLTTTSYTWDTEQSDSGMSILNNNIRVTLESYRGGIVSLQKHDFSFSRVGPPANITLPVISGQVIEGGILAVSDGTWGFSPLSFTYQWQRDFVDIVGEESNTYTLLSIDSGLVIRCKVTAINDQGSVSVFSNSVSFGQIPFLTGWARRRPITIDAALIDSDLTHFAVPIILSTSSGIGNTDLSDFFTEISNTDRKKIAVTDSTGINQLNVEIEFYDSTTQRGVLWVSNSSFVISSTNETTFFLYYDSTQSDNSSFVGDTGEVVAQNVWDSSFSGVYHMSSTMDSTSNARHGIKGTGGSSPTDSTDGKIGNSQSFDGVGDFISINQNVLQSNEFTIEFIEKSTSPNTGYFLCDSLNVENLFLRRAVEDSSGGSITGRIGLGNIPITIVSADIFNNHRVIKESNGNINWYVNNISVASSSGSTFTGLAGNLYIGDRPDLQRSFSGIIDEVRISTIIRSAAYGSVSNLSFNDSLISIGNIQVP